MLWALNKAQRLPLNAVEATATELFIRWSAIRYASDMGCAYGILQPWQEVATLGSADGANSASFAADGKRPPSPAMAEAVKLFDTELARGVYPAALGTRAQGFNGARFSLTETASFGASSGQFTYSAPSWAKSRQRRRGKAEERNRKPGRAEAAPRHQHKTRLSPRPTRVKPSYHFPTSSSPAAPPFILP